jgi:Domain of unknown function (DUF397)
MKRVANAAADLGSEGWHKPWSGSNGGNCVEAKRLDDGSIALRNSTHPEGPALMYSRSAIAEFINAAKSGAADFLFTGPQADEPDPQPHETQQPHHTSANEGTK